MHNLTKILVLAVFLVFLSFDVFADTDDIIQIEAEYISECQIIAHPIYPEANGAINNVCGYNPDYPQPDYIIPGENAMAILGLITASSILNDDQYLEMAQLAADYFIRVQNADGSWFNKYDYLHGHDQGKSPRHVAQLMMAFYKLGYDSQRYDSVILGAEYLISCFNSDLNLINGGKDSQGFYSNEYWLTDNCFAYHAFMAAYAWAKTHGDTKLSLEYANYAGNIIQGINSHLKDITSSVWYERIDRFGNPIENPLFPNWIKYAPLFYSVPVADVLEPAVGEWIHTAFQQPDGSCIGYVYDEQGSKTNTRKYPGHSFQSALCWQRLGGAQAAYAQNAINWAQGSGLWKTTLDPAGVIGGWIDWVEVEPNPGAMPQDWERYIDTSALCIFALNGGYNFSTETFVLRVPQDYPNIQNAINAAWDTCTVLVSDGIYTGEGNRNIDFTGKAITVKSENGPDSTIIDCALEYGNRGFNFQVASQDSILQGFTIQNGSHLEGGGILCVGAYPTIKECIIKNNHSVLEGGGIRCFIGSPKIIDCLIIGNISGGVGGGISCYLASPEITNCIFENNQTGLSGGAIGCYEQSNPIINSSTINSNIALGGAGGALFCGHQSNPIVSNCLISNNQAVASHSEGGAIYCNLAGPLFYNCTITGNSSARSGGAIRCDEPSPTFTNCILWQNSPNEIYVFYGGVLSVNFSDVSGGYPGIDNINLDPLFSNPVDNDFHLRLGSPCIDTGDSASSYINEPEPNGNRIDMGTYGNTSQATASIGFEPNVDGKVIDISSKLPIKLIKVNGELKRAVLSLRVLASEAEGDLDILVENCPAWLGYEISTTLPYEITFYVNQRFLYNPLPISLGQLELVKIKEASVRVIATSQTTGESSSINVVFRENSKTSVIKK